MLILSVIIRDQVVAARVVRAAVGRVEVVRAVRAAMVLEHVAHVGEPKGHQAADDRAVAIVLVDPIEFVLPRPELKNH